MRVNDLYYTTFLMPKKSIDHNIFRGVGNSSVCFIAQGQGPK